MPARRTGEGNSRHTAPGEVHGGIEDMKPRVMPIPVLQVPDMQLQGTEKKNGSRNQ